MHNTKSLIGDAKLAIQKVRKNRAFDPQEFGRALAERMDSCKTRIHPTTRHGDFDATAISGNQFHVCCRRCKIEGSIFLPDDSDRNRCPKCAKLPLEEWRIAGFAGLLPPEPKPKRFIMPVTVDSEDESEVEQSEDDDTMVELSLEVAVIEAGEDEVEITEVEPEEEEVEDAGAGEDGVSNE
jgi:hypothetical protein